MISRLEAQFPSQASHYGLGAGYSGGISDQTGECVIKRWETEQDIRILGQRIREVEIVLNAFGVEDRKLLQLRYLQKYAKDWSVAKQLDIPLRSYYRVRDSLIIEAAVMFGYIATEQVSFEEMGWRA